MIGPRASESLYVESRSNGGASLKNWPIARATYSTEAIATFSGRNALSTSNRWNGVSLSSQSSGRGAVCGASALLKASHTPILSTTCCLSPASVATSVSMASSAFHDLSSSQPAPGLTGAPSSSGAWGLRKNAHSSGDRRFDCRSIEAAIRKAKSPLCFSKSPRQIITNMVLVMLLMRIWSRSSSTSDASAARTVLVRTSLKYCSEYWYIGSTVVKSATTK
mmetsp:Transcript_13825/g.40612  ORF Transcript_13825/g.40612 Transcript_13825/m.40612 type:complete len:221 (-) Transcript_13825:2550-3212(-)